MVDSEHYENTVDAIEDIKSKNIPLYGVELTEDAKDFQKVEYPKRVALVLGHEKRGIQEDILEMCDKKIMVPMRGHKESLNVANCASILLYEITREK
jgi:TrmH family RNA methyltransferase